MLDDDERAQHGDSESAGAGAAATGARHYGERTPGKSDGPRTPIQKIQQLFAAFQEVSIAKEKYD